jgi:CBS domain-containing protein
MQVKKIMTKNPACCTSDSTLQEVAHMMEMYDCGCIPVVENHQTKRPIGTVTDRDITIRTFSQNKNPIEMKASDIMTTDIVTVTPETSVDECLNVMENRQIRRILIVDKNNRCVGIVAQADLAEHVQNPTETMEFLREVSESEFEHSRDRRFESDRSPDYERRNYRQNNRSFSQHQPPQPPNRSREIYRRSYPEKESSSNGKMLLTLLGSIGLGAGLSYYFGLDGENKHRPSINRKKKTYNLDAKNTVNNQTGDLSIHTPPLSVNRATPLSTSTTDRTEDRDTFGDNVGSFNKTNDDSDLKPITEIGRTATNT